MADDPKVPPGTRYDALRMIPLLGWEKAGKQLTRYLAKDAHAELQMGAVSGSADIDAPQAAAALIDALPHLTAGNRRLAVAALFKTEVRAGAILSALETKRVSADLLVDAEKKSLRMSPHESIRRRAIELFGP